MLSFRTLVGPRIGSVVTLFKDDWWKRVVEVPADLAEQRSQLVSVLTWTLSGEVQIIDGMDARKRLERVVVLFFEKGAQDHPRKVQSTQM